MFIFEVERSDWTRFTTQSFGHPLRQVRSYDMVGLLVTCGIHGFFLRGLDVKHGLHIGLLVAWVEKNYTCAFWLSLCHFITHCNVTNTIPKDNIHKNVSKLTVQCTIK